MRRFVWRLQRVLDIKAKEEKAKRTELLKLTEKLAQTQGELMTRQMTLDNIIQDISNRDERKRLNEQELFFKVSWIIDEQIKKLKKQVVKLKLQQKEKIAEVLKVKRFKEGLEKLQEEAKREFIKEQEKLEQKELDEGAVISFVRKITR